jgi:hypothetical protein
MAWVTHLREACGKTEHRGDKAKYPGLLAMTIYSLNLTIFLQFKL